MLSWCVLNGVHQNHWIFLSWFLLLLQLFFLISLCTYLYIFHCDITKLHSFHFSSVICMQIECLIYHNLHKSTVSGLRWNIVPADRAQIPVSTDRNHRSVTHMHAHTHRETKREAKRWMGVPALPSSKVKDMVAMETTVFRFKRWIWAIYQRAYLHIWASLQICFMNVRGFFFHIGNGVILINKIQKG